MQKKKKKVHAYVAIHANKGLHTRASFPPNFTCEIIYVTFCFLQATPEIAPKKRTFFPFGILARMPKGKNVLFLGAIFFSAWILFFFQNRSKYNYDSCLAQVAQLDAPSDWRPGGRGFDPRRGRQHSFVEIDHEIFSTVILSLRLIQEGQLSVSGERMCTILVNRVED